jgi:hypothetical protein
MRRTPALFDVILADAAITVTLSGVRMPPTNTIMERWIQSYRHELLDRTLLRNQAHLLHPLPDYERHHNRHRPHRGIANTRPLRPLPEPITHPATPTRSAHPQTRSARRTPPPTRPCPLTSTDRISGTRKVGERLDTAGLVAGPPRDHCLPGRPDRRPISVFGSPCAASNTIRPAARARLAPSTNVSAPEDEHHHQDGEPAQPRQTCPLSRTGFVKSLQTRDTRSLENRQETFLHVQI